MYYGSEVVCFGEVVGFLQRRQEKRPCDIALDGVAQAREGGLVREYEQTGGTW